MRVEFSFEQVTGSSKYDYIILMFVFLLTFEVVVCGAKCKKHILCHLLRYLLLLLYLKVSNPHDVMTSSHICGSVYSESYRVASLFIVTFFCCFIVQNMFYLCLPAFACRVPSRDVLTKPSIWGSRYHQTKSWFVIGSGTTDLASFEVTVLWTMSREIEAASSKHGIFATKPHSRRDSCRSLGLGCYWRTFLDVRFRRKSPHLNLA